MRKIILERQPGTKERQGGEQAMKRGKQMEERQRQKVQGWQPTASASSARKGAKVGRKGWRQDLLWCSSPQHHRGRQHGISCSPQGSVSLHTGAAPRHRARAAAPPGTAGSGPTPGAPTGTGGRARER